jgi:hypothetical protein
MLQPLVTQAIDYLTLAVVLVALLLAYLTGRQQAYGRIKNITQWITLAILFLALRKIFDFLGEYLFMAQNDYFNLFEDLSFLGGVVFLMVSGSKALNFFRSINFKK